jgi:hypothetical protein
VSFLIKQKGHKKSPGSISRGGAAIILEKLFYLIKFPDAGWIRQK